MRDEDFPGDNQGNGDPVVGDEDSSDAVQLAADLAVEPVVDQLSQTYQVKATEESADKYANEATVAQKQGVDISERVEDYDKAKIMACSAKDDRDSAAHSRKWAARLEENFLNSPPEDPNNPYDKSMNNSDWQEHEEYYQEQRDNLQRDVKDSQEHASEMDKRAARTEYWAGILHDHPIGPDYLDAHRIETLATILRNHPVSVRYQKANSDIKFDAGCLYDIEQMLYYRQDAIKEAEFRIRDADVFKIFGGIEIVGDATETDIDTLIDTFARNSASLTETQQESDEVYRKSIEELKGQLRSLMGKTETTLGQIRQFYYGLFDEVYLKSWRNEASVLGVLLDDVKSGRASNPPQPEAQAT
jgi:hypothetical protein